MVSFHSDFWIFCDFISLSLPLFTKNIQCKIFQAKHSPTFVDHKFAHKTHNDNLKPPIIILPMSSRKPASSLTYAVAAWVSVAVTTFVVRKLKKRRILQRETRVAQQGGLLPSARNAVQALEIRATSPEACEKLALASADGCTTYSWKEYYEQVQMFARSLMTVSNDASNGGEQCGVAIHAFNEPRWFFAAVGALAAGWSVSGIYLVSAKHSLSAI